MRSGPKAFAYTSPDSRSRVCNCILRKSSLYNFLFADEGKLKSDEHADTVPCFCDRKRRSLPRMRFITESIWALIRKWEAQMSVAQRMDDLPIWRTCDLSRHAFDLIRIHSKDTLRCMHHKPRHTPLGSNEARGVDGTAVLRWDTWHLAFARRSAATEKYLRRLHVFFANSLRFAASAQRKTYAPPKVTLHT